MYNVTIKIILNYYVFSYYVISRLVHLNTFVLNQTFVIAYEVACTDLFINMSKKLKLRRE